jgi:hypothetical protein
MEIAWLAVAGALVAALLGADGSPVPLWIALAVGFAGFVLMRFFVPEDATLGMARGFMAATGVVVLYLAVALLPGLGMDFAWPLRLGQDWQAARHVIVGGVLIGVFWWRGARLGQEDVSSYSVANSFRIGVAVVVVGAVLHVMLPVSLSATAATFLFFGAGIAAFALAHITSMAPEESAGLRDWPRMAALTVGGIVVGSVALSLAAEGDLGRVAASGFQLALRLLTPVAIVIGWGIGFIVETVTYAFLFVAAALRGDGPPATFNPTMPNFGNVDPNDVDSGLLPWWLLRFLGWVAVLLVAAGAAYFLWKTLGTRARSRYRGTDEERERLDSEGALADDLAAALGALLGKLAPRRSRPAHSLADLDPDDPSAVALGAYRGLLVLAEEQGTAREPWETPHEFAPDLDRLFPPDDVRLLTQAFVRARYGAIPPTPDETARLRTAWNTLRQKE